MTTEEAKQFVEQVHREKIEKNLELFKNAEDNEYGSKQPELTLHIEAEDPTGTLSSELPRKSGQERKCCWFSYS